MEQEQEKLYDVIVIGGGPAGLTAALYLARARYRVLVVEKERFGGQIALTAELVNYPGVERTSGAALTETMRRQAQGFGAEFLLAEAEGLDLTGPVKTVQTSRGPLRAFGVLLATGAQPRKIGFTGEEAFKGRGVAYCATCDGEFFTGRDLIVVGGGFAAAEEAVFLTRYARHVTILIRRDDFSCAASVADAARSHEKITVLTNTELEEVGGDTALGYARWRNTRTGETTEYRPAEGFGVFVFAGYEPATALVRDLDILDEAGYVVTGRDQETAIPGLYAAGDLCVKKLRQVVTAVGDGAKAAAALEKYARALREATGLHPPVTRLPPDRGVLLRKTQKIPPQGVFGFFTPEIRAQLSGVFEKMARPLVLRLSLDERPVSEELRHYMEELAAMTDKLRLEILPASSGEDPPRAGLYLEDGTYRGIAFHGVPGGHEFNSFVVGLYNAAGPGQALDAEVAEALRAVRGPVSMKILVSLSCTMCPELVMAAQRMAAENPRITAEAYDLNHFPELRERYQVMSVPCLVINDRIVSFGKKNIREILALLAQGE
jgi:thioredoxin reductase (NADPH)